MAGQGFSREWVFPPGVGRLLRRREIRRRLRRPLSQEETDVLSNNGRFRDLHVGRACFVIGNGPSLSGEDLSPLGREITIVMNSFGRHPIVSEWRPTFYCRAEPGGSYDTPQRLATITAQTKAIDAQAFFFPIEARRHIEGNSLLPGLAIHYYKSVVDLTEWPVRAYPLDLTRAMPYAGNTAHLAIMLAIYLGCSPIYLLGMDHDWLAHRSVSRHFYPHKPDDAGGSDDLGTYSYATMMKDTLREWSRYEMLGEIAASRGCTILNATKDSFLDVFPAAEPVR